MSDSQVEKPPAFKLPRAAWIAWIVGAGITAYAHADKLSGGAYGFGYLMGSIVGLFLIPSILAWIVWRLSRRSQRGAVITFILILAILVAGKIPQAREQSKQKAALDQFTQNIQNEKAELKVQVEQGENATQEQLENLTSQIQDNLSQLVDSSKGQDREIALAMQEFLARGQDLQKRHGQTIADLQLETFLDLNGHENAALRAKKIAGIEAWRKANLALRDFVANATTTIRQKLEDREVSWVNIRDVLAGYRKSTASNNVAILAIRDLDTKLADTLTEFIAFAEKYEGKWGVDPETGGLQLPNDEAVETYNDLITEVNRISEKQIALQRQVLTQ